MPGRIFPHRRLRTLQTALSALRLPPSVLRPPPSARLKMDSAESSPRKRSRTLPFVEEEETTDLKLALLSSLHPTADTSMLLELLLISHGSVATASALLLQPSASRHASTSQQSSLAPFLTTAAPVPRPPKKGHTLHLYTPNHFAALTPTTLLPSFLPAPLAATLLTELLRESNTFTPSPEFVLFGRTVVSPHTACLFLRDLTPSSHQYTYQGASVPESRLFTPSMRSATALVEAAVNAELLRRERRRGQLPPGAWHVNAALVNCYRGGDQSVGWHTDQLTYLGPATVIASVSLGCVREFRVRRVGAEAEGEGAYGLWLPHNSLLVMHAGMQEGWKHSIHPAKSVDLHPVAGNTRINITYRCYRESLRPELTPRCNCGEPTVLRAAPGKGYIWTCTQDYKPGCESCGYLAWAKFDEFGEPPWSENFVPDGQEEESEGSGYEMLSGVVEDEVDDDDDEGSGDKNENEDVVMVEKEQEQELRDWSDETLGGSERDLDEDWSDGEDASIARELQEWRDGLV